ncbi:hypothetical protein B566_EDAN006427 [Ephemera danica]|nr:hypothetical protein B566_EDAN006427 [Ephemera danica]
MRGGEEPGTCWGSCHVVWGLCYVAAGAVQLVAGLFALLSLPVLGLGSNVWTGAWNMVAGITSALLAGLVSEVGASRQELLLYTSLSVLGFNTVNLVLLEAGEWSLLLPESTRQDIAHRGLSRLVFYARVSTSLSTALVLVTSLLDAHVSYCLLQAKHRHVGGRHRAMEPVTDIEYVIPRKKTLESEDEETLTNRSHNQNAQSWVFDAGPADKNYLQDTLDALSLGGGSDSASEEPNSYLLSHGSPPAIVVKVEPAPVEDRTLNHMKSFSRTPSPTFSLSHPQYEIVPDDSPARTRLYTADYIYHQRASDSKRTHRRCESVDNRPHSASSIHTGVAAGGGVVETIQYASLMLELEQAIQSKRPVTESSPSSSSNPSSQLKDSDTEFSKELEAALQLLQDLGSPTTIDTPTEPNRTILENVNISAGGRALSDQEHDGKQQVAVTCHHTTVEVVSASSSGYSSPARGSSLTQLGSTPTGPSATLACSIRNEGTRAIVSLYPSEHIKQHNGITTIAIHSSPPPPSQTRRSISLHPELVNVIYENGSLAYLSELELLARLYRNKAEHRLVEQRAQDKVRKLSGTSCSRIIVCGYGMI